MIFKDNNRQVEIEDHLLRRMHRYCQNGRNDNESGGVLIGREVVETNNLILTHMTEPMENDKRSRSSFYRKDNGHVIFFNNLYTEFGGIYGYFGEWHTHPEKIPLYSSFDLHEWHKIIKSSNRYCPLYCLILGTEVWRMWSIRDLKAKPVLLCERNFKDCFEGKGS